MMFKVLFNKFKTLNKSKGENNFCMEKRLFYNFSSIENSMIFLRSSNEYSNIRKSSDLDALM